MLYNIWKMMTVVRSTPTVATSPEVAETLEIILPILSKVDICNRVALAWIGVSKYSVFLQKIAYPMKPKKYNSKAMDRNIQMDSFLMALQVENILFLTPTTPSGQIAGMSMNCRVSGMKRLYSSANMVAITTIRKGRVSFVTPFLMTISPLMVVNTNCSAITLGRLVEQQKYIRVLTEQSVRRTTSQKLKVSGMQISSVTLDVWSLKVEDYWDQYKDFSCQELMEQLLGGLGRTRSRVCNSGTSQIKDLVALNSILQNYKPSSNPNTTNICQFRTTAQTMSQVAIIQFTPWSFILMIQCYWCTIRPRSYSQPLIPQLSSMLLRKASMNLLRGAEKVMDTCLDDVAKQVILQNTLIQPLVEDDDRYSLEMQINVLTIKLTAICQNKIQAIFSIPSKKVSDYLEQSMRSAVSYVRTHPVCVGLGQVAKQLLCRSLNQAEKFYLGSKATLENSWKFLQEGQLKAFIFNSIVRIGLVLRAAYCYTKQSRLCAKSKQAYDCIHLRYREMKQRFKQSQTGTQYHMLKDEAPSSDSCPSINSSVCGFKMLKMRSYGNMSKSAGLKLEWVRPYPGPKIEVERRGQLERRLVGWKSERGHSSDYSV